MKTPERALSCRGREELCVHWISLFQTFLSKILSVKNRPEIRQVDALGARVPVRNHPARPRAEDLITETHSTVESKTESKKVRVTLQ